MKRRGSSRFLAARRWRGRSSPARSRPSECDASVYFCLHRRRIRNFRPGSGLPASAGAIGMDDWTQCADRHPLGRRPRQYHPKTRGGVGRARAEAIFAHDNAAVGALQQISRTVPIVFPVIGDPVAAGFIDSLARPGGNATGFMNFEFALSSKWLETIKQIAPGATRVAVLRDPAVGSGTTQFAVIQAAAPTMGYPSQHARGWRNCALHREFRGCAEWRIDRHSGRGRAPSSRSDH